MWTMENSIRFGFLCLIMLFGVTLAQHPFGDMERFELVGYEVLSDPRDVLSDLVETSINALEPDGIGFRFYFSQEGTPSVLFQDVCPAGYEATWYTFNSEAKIPISFGFYVEVSPEGADRSEWFSPIYMDAYRSRAGNPTFLPPVHVAFCAYSATRGAYRISHNIFVENESRTFSTLISCRIMINNSGSQRILDAQQGRSVVSCFN
jgi:hypothetical protein